MKDGRNPLRIRGGDLEEEHIQLLSNKDSIDSPYFSPNHSLHTANSKLNSTSRLLEYKDRFFRSSLSTFRSSLILFVGITFSLVLVGILVVCFTFLILRNKAYQTSGFLDPLIPSTSFPELLVEPVRLNNTKLESYQSELEQRLVTLGLPVSTLECTFNATHQEHYSNLISPTTFSLNPNSTHPKTLIAINLYNNEEVFPTLARTLLSVSHYLGFDSVHISIFENGSTDKTLALLAHFASTLSGMKIDHTILSDPTKTDWKNVDRIAQLAVYRNLVLEPLYSSTNSNPNSTNWDTVLFVNDVFVCETDILELLWQRKAQSASAACAMDWRKAGISWFGLNGIKFYDNWVSRTIKGEMFRNRFDILAETRNGLEELFDQPGSEYSRNRFQAGVPLPVSLDAKPFIIPNEDGEVVRFRSALNQLKQCAASECKTIAKDFWSRGFNRWMIVPSVRVTYQQAVYNHPLLKSLIARKFTPILGISEWIDWSSIIPPTSVICYPWMRGWHIDLPYRRTRESP